MLHGRLIDEVTEAGHLTGDVTTAFVRNGEYTPIAIPRWVSGLSASHASASVIGRRMCRPR